MDSVLQKETLFSAYVSHITWATTAKLIMVSSPLKISSVNVIKSAAVSLSPNCNGILGNTWQITMKLSYFKNLFHFIVLVKLQTGLQLYFKKWLHRRCTPVNFMVFFRGAFFMKPPRTAATVGNGANLLTSSLTVDFNSSMKCPNI